MYVSKSEGFRTRKVFPAWLSKLANLDICCYSLATIKIMLSFNSVNDSHFLPKRKLSSPGFPENYWFNYESLTIGLWITHDSIMILFWWFDHGLILIQSFLDHNLIMIWLCMKSHIGFWWRWDLFPELYYENAIMIVTFLYVVFWIRAWMKLEG